MSTLASSSPLFDGATAARAYAGLGVLGADIPTSGDWGGSPIANDSPIADHEYAWFVDTAPATGALTLYPDGSFTYQAEGDGSYFWTYSLYDDGVFAGTGSVSIYVGTSVASGVTLTGTSNISTSGASASSDATASGVSLSGASDITTGGASEGSPTADGVADGVALSGESSVITASAGAGVLTAQDLINIEAILIARIQDIAAATLAATVDGTKTLAESIRIQNAVLAGKVSGAGTGTETFRDINDTKNRVVATVDSSGNRTAIVLDAT